MNEAIAIKEYESITVNKGDKQINESEFTQLCDFITSQKEYEKAFSVNTQSKTITAKNWVGCIQTKQGTTIEILPKIDLAGDSSSDSNKKTKDIFLKMLKTLKDFRHLKIDNASLEKTKKLPIWEVFISMFLSELQLLLRRGLQKGYEVKEENLNVWRGKMLFNENIRYNLANQARFFMRYDEYTANRAENKLIKSTLAFLKRHSQSPENQQKIRQNLNFFAEIDFSDNIAKDFQLWEKHNRLLKHYQKLLGWCKLFLNHQTISSFSGKEVAISLLFPMEQVFESFVAHCFNVNEQEFKAVPQSRTESLCKYKNTNFYYLKPDLKLLKKGELIAILDTKWKELKAENVTNPQTNDSVYKKYEVSQSDMYQMFAYSRIHNCDQVFLIYPKSENFTDQSGITFDFNTTENEQPVNTTENEQPVNTAEKGQPKCICYPFDLENAANDSKEEVEKFYKNNLKLTTTIL